MVRNRTLCGLPNRVDMLISVLSSMAYAMRFFILLTMFAVGSLLADPVLSFDTTTALTGANFDQTVGWEFNVVSAITVTGLGWYDQGADGLQLAHMVGIWNSTGTTLLTSATVAAGTTDPLDGLFRTVAITPIVLAPGEYIVGGQNFATNSDVLAFDVTPIYRRENLLRRRRVFGFGQLVRIPDNPTIVPDCCWGPSFSVSAASVNTPEPAGSSLLLAAGALAAALLARRRQSL